MGAAKQHISCISLALKSKRKTITHNQRHTHTHTQQRKSNSNIRKTYFAITSAWWSDYLLSIFFHLVLLQFAAVATDTVAVAAPLSIHIFFLVFAFHASPEKSMPFSIWFYEHFDFPVADATVTPMFCELCVCCYLPITHTRTNICFDTINRVKSSAHRCCCCCCCRCPRWFRMRKQFFGNWNPIKFMTNTNSTNDRISLSTKKSKRKLTNQPTNDDDDEKRMAKQIELYTEPQTIQNQHLHLYIQRARWSEIEKKNGSEWERYSTHTVVQLR